MSTKTSFKRIAAVAVLALGLGGISAVSSQATVLGDNLAVSSTSVAATIGTASSVVVTQTFLSNGSAHADTATVAAYLISAPTGSVATPSFDITPANVAAVLSTAVSKNATQFQSGATTSADNSASGPISVTAASLMKFTPDLTGTYVIKLAQTLSAGTSSSTVQTVTITAAAPAAVTTASSRVYMQAGDAVAGNGGALSLALSGGYKAVPNNNGVSVATNLAAIIANVATQDASTSNLATTSASSTVGTVAATFGVVVGNSTSLATSNITPAIQDVTGGTYNPTGAFTAAGFPETIKIDGPGLISVPGIGAVGKTYLDASGQINYLQRQFSVISDGNAGLSTITVSVNGVVIGTKTITFYSSPAKVVASANNAYVSKASGAAKAAAIEVAVTDADGHPAPLGSYTLVATSSDKTVISSTSACVADTTTLAHADEVGYYTCTVNTAAGVVASGSKADLTYALTKSDATVVATSNAVTITATGTTIASLAVTFNADSYAPGDKVTATLTAKDSSGNPVADGTYGVFSDASPAVFAGFSTSAQITSALFAETAGLAIKNGVATSSFYAPYADGVVNVSATLPATNVNNGVATALASTSVAGSFTVANPASAASQAAIDAAQEATDAANAAYDAANNAMDSADAATAAAQDASDNASAALAAVTSLSATVAKLVASVNAIASALAKIQKKLKA